MDIIDSGLITLLERLEEQARVEVTALLKEHAISTTDALRIAELIGVSVTQPTVNKWCRKYGIGYKLNPDQDAPYTRWRIFPIKFIKVLYGKN